MNLEPSYNVEDTSTSPPKASILDFTTSSPTPLPDTSETVFAIEKLGKNKKSMISCLVNDSACSSVTIPRSIAFAFTLSVSIPLPSSRTSITTLFPS